MAAWGAMTLVEFVHQVSGWHCVATVLMRSQFPFRWNGKGKMSHSTMRSSVYSAKTTSRYALFGVGPWCPLGCALQALSHLAAKGVNYESLDATELTVGRRGFLQCVFSTFAEQFVTEPVCAPVTAGPGVANDEYATGMAVLCAHDLPLLACHSCRYIAQ